MKCRICKYKQDIGSTKETGAALCARNTAYFPVKVEDSCHFIPEKRELLCRDCERFGEDFACFTQRETDPVYEEGEMCTGFIDRKEQMFKEILLFWKVQGLRDRTEIEKMLNEVDEIYDDIELQGGTAVCKR